MTLKELLKSDFGVDLPISGGSGNAIENPIVIHKTEISDCVDTEHFILDCLAKGRRIEWNILKQELLNHNNKKIDKIEIETIETTKDEIITQIENYYFDVTDSFGTKKEPGYQFNEQETLDKIKQCLLELEEQNDFNKKCIDKLRKEELFKDTKLTVEFLDVIFNDKSLPYFESMMYNKGKPILDVLRILGKEI